MLTEELQPAPVPREPWHNAFPSPWLSSSPCLLCAHPWLCSAVLGLLLVCLQPKGCCTRVCINYYYSLALLIVKGFSCEERASEGRRRLFLVVCCSPILSRSELVEVTLFRPGYGRTVLKLLFSFIYFWVFTLVLTFLCLA